jgi:hypothetical protein
MVRGELQDAEIASARALKLRTRLAAQFPVGKTPNEGGFDNGNDFSRFIIRNPPLGADNLRRLNLLVANNCGARPTFEFARRNCGTKLLFWLDRAWLDRRHGVGHSVHHGVSPPLHAVWVWQGLDVS